MNFVRIFNTLKLWMPMIPTPGRMPFNLFSSIRLLVACCGLLLACGCQKLFHDQDALLKGRTVAVSMSVQDTPPPAAQALPVAESAAPAPALPLRPLDQRLLPTQQPVSMQPSQPLAASSERPAAAARQQLAEAAVVLTERVMTEDLVLRGTVLVKGSLIVAPQATLRIEAGTTVRFAADPTVLQPGRLVVQGRLVTPARHNSPFCWDLRTRRLNLATGGGWSFWAVRKRTVSITVELKEPRPVSLSRMPISMPGVCR